MRALIRRCGGGATTFGVGTTMLLFMMALLVLGASAHAQEPVRAWVGGRIFAEVDTSIFSDAVGGIGGGLRAGLDWRRLGLEFGVDRPVEHERVVIEEYAAAGGRVRSTRRITRSSPGWQVLAAGHVYRTPRVRLTLRAGYANVTHRNGEQTVTIEMFGSDGRLLSQSDLTVAARNYRWHGVALGAACGLVLSHHLEAVPSFELMLFPGSDAPGQVIARGGVGLFWRF